MLISVKTGHSRGLTPTKTGVKVNYYTRSRKRSLCSGVRIRCGLLVQKWELAMTCLCKSKNRCGLLVREWELAVASLWRSENQLRPACAGARAHYDLLVHCAGVRTCCDLLVRKWEPTVTCFCEWRNPCDLLLQEWKPAVTCLCGCENPKIL